MTAESQLLIYRWNVARDSKTGQPFKAMINPEQYTFKRKIEFNETTKLYTSDTNTLVLGRIVIDATGVVPVPTGMPETIEGQVGMLNNIATQYDGGKVVYPVVLVVWGDMSYIGRVTDIDVEFKLFAPDGTPLRAHITVTLKEFRRHGETTPSTDWSLDKAGLQAPPDLIGLAAMCIDVYGDDSMLETVARFNDLTSFRNIDAGTDILLPEKA